MDDERNPEDGVLGLSTKVIDHLRDDIGMSVHFPAGESVAIIPPDTLNKICGTVTTRQIMPTGFTIHGGDNNGDEPLHATISFGGANGTKPEPLNTVDRVFAIHAGGSGEHASCAAAHAVLRVMVPLMTAPGNRSQLATLKALAGSQEAGSAFDTAALGPDQGFHAEMFSSGINVGDGIGLQTIDSSSTPTAGGGDAQVQRHNAEAADDQVDVN